MAEVAALFEALSISDGDAPALPPAHCDVDGDQAEFRRVCYRDVCIQEPGSLVLPRSFR